MSRESNLKLREQHFTNDFKKNFKLLEVNVQYVKINSRLIVHTSEGQSWVAQYSKGEIDGHSFFTY